MPAKKSQTSTTGTKDREPKAPRKQSTTSGRSKKQGGTSNKRQQNSKLFVPFDEKTEHIKNLATDNDQMRFVAHCAKFIIDDWSKCLEEQETSYQDQFSVDLIPNHVHKAACQICGNGAQALYHPRVEGVYVCNDCNK